MEVPQDARFRRERELFRLRFCCEDCVLFDPGRGCAHRYPTSRHHVSRYDDPDAAILFCKDFELL